MRSPVANEGGQVVVAGEKFDISTTATDDGCISYVDPVLAQIGRDLIELRDIENEAKRQIRRLEERQNKRIRALNMLGTLHAYPTQQQRGAIATLQNAVKLKMPEMIKVAYDLCIATGAHKSNWRSEHGEPLPTYVSRELDDIERAQIEALIAAIGGDEGAGA